jgi:hypothetical protein
MIAQGNQRMPQRPRKHRAASQNSASDFTTHDRRLQGVTGLPRARPRECRQISKSSKLMKKILSKARWRQPADFLLCPRFLPSWTLARKWRAPSAIALFLVRPVARLQLLFSLFSLYFQCFGMAEVRSSKLRAPTTSDVKSSTQPIAVIPALSAVIVSIRSIVILLKEAANNSGSLCDNSINAGHEIIRSAVFCAAIPASRQHDNGNQHVARKRP